MQKKILLSLLIASPTAVPALANVNYGSGTWVPTGVAGDDVSIKDGDVSCQLGSGVTVRTESLVPGKYTLHFDNTSNLRVVISQDGQELSNTEYQAGNNIDIDFEVETEGDVLISTDGITASAYSFQGANLQLNLMPNEIYEDLSAQLQALNEKFTTISDEEFAGAAELLEEKEAIVSQIKEWETAIEVLQGQTEITTESEAFKFYKEQELYADPTKVDTAIKGIDDEITEWNEKATALNTAISNTEINKANKADLLKGQEYLAATIDALIEKINNNSDYAKDANIGNAVEIQKEIEAYKAEIEAAYTPEAMAKEVIKFENQKDAILAKITAVETKWNTDVADWDAYQTYMNTVYPTLQNAYNDAVTKIGALSGVKGHDLVFDDLKDQKIKEAENTFNDYKAQLKITSAAGAAALLEGDQKTVETAVAALNKIAADFADLIAAQNENFTTAQLKLKDLDTQLGEYTALTVIPDSMKEEYNKAVGSATKAIADLQTYVEEQYEATTLDVAEGSKYAEDVAAIETTLSELEKLVGPIKDINELQKNLDTAKSEIKEASDLFAEHGLYGNLYGLFANQGGTFDSIQKAIDGLKTEEQVDAQKGDIQKSIDTAKATADRLIDVFTELDAAKTQYPIDRKSLEDFVAGRTELGADGKPADALKKAFWATGAGKDFDNALKTFNDELTALNDEETPQEVYNKAVEMQEKYVKEVIETTDPETKGTVKTYVFTWQENLTATEIAFAKEVTDSNKTYLDASIKAAKDFVADGEYAGKDSISFTDIDTKAAEIATAIADAATADKPADAYNAADEEIEKLFPDVDAINTLADKYKQNQADYDALLGLLTGEDGLQTLIDNLVAQNDKESKDNGKAFFANFINGEDNDNSIQAQLDKIKTDLDAALAAYADAEKNVTGQKTALNTRINTLKSLIEKTSTDITNNNTAHTNQLNTAELASQELVQALEKLDDLYNEQGDIKDWYDETKAKLETLRDGDLFNANLAVAEAYGKGQSYTNDATLSGAYQSIRNQVKEIMTSMDSEYEAQVRTYNEGIFTAWTDEYFKELNAAYTKAVTDYNRYYYGLTNQGWRNFVFETIQRHETIYGYSAKITELNKDLRDAITAANDAQPMVVFTQEEYEVFTDQADNMKAEMATAVDNMNADATTAANNYYNQQKGAADTQIAGYETQLEDAGLTDECLNTVKKALTDAQTKYAAATADDATDPLGIAMDAIADDLDEALAPVDLQKIAAQAWKEAYDKDTTDAQAILSALNNKDSEDYAFADQTLRKANITAIEDAISQMESLNTEVTGITKDLISQYKDYKSQLDDLMADINGWDQEVKDSSTGNLDNQNLYTNYTTVVIPGLEDDLKALMEYADSMVGGQNYDTASIAARIDALNQYVEDNKSVLTENKTALETEQTAIKNLIKGGYPGVGNAEYTYLNGTLLGQVKAAFNDAKAAFNGADDTTSNLDPEKGADQLAAWNTEIDELAEAVIALNTMLDPADFDKAAFSEKALKIEKELSDIYVALEQSWTSEKHDGEDPATAVLAALNDQYNEISAAITDARTYMEGCEPTLDTTDYAEKLTELEGELNAVLAAWEAAGNRVIDMQPTYVRMMDAIAAEVASTDAALKTANEEAIAAREKKEANDAAYTRLSDEITELTESLDRVKGIAEEWYGNQYDGSFERIQDLIDTAKSDLDAENEKTALDADSELVAAPYISNAISSLETRIAERKATEERNAAFDAMQTAGSALNASFVPEDAQALSERYTTLANDYDANYNRQVGWDPEAGEHVEVTIETLYEVIDEYERIAEAFGEFTTDANEQAYVPGDVDLNPDGLVTAIDVQQMISWVLQGTTWQDLLAQNARQAYAADLNGDQTLNITDVTMDISWMFGENPALQRIARFAAPAVDPTTGIGIELVSEENGRRRYALTLDNTAAMIGAQLDLKLPFGMRIAEISTADRTAAHEVESYDRDSSYTRVVIYSMENAAFEGNNGAILLIDVEGAGDLKAENVIFTDSYFNTHEIAGAETSLIDQIKESARDAGSAIYNAAGMVLDKLQNGINILRDSNGKGRKILRRDK